MRNLVLSLSLGLLVVSMVLGQDVKKNSDPLPVAVAKNGFTPAQGKDLMQRYSYEEALKAGDVSLYLSLNYASNQPVVTVARSGEVRMLEKAVDSKIGQIRVKGEHGDLTLADYLIDPKSRAQGMIVIHQGKIVFEEYPGMREFDSKAWMSNTKTIPALIIALLEAEGKIDVNKPIDAYIPSFKGTAWAGTKVIDILDMTSGMDILETPETRLDPRSTINRTNLAQNGRKNADGKVEQQFDVIRSAPREKRAGEAFDYSSVNTLVLGLLAEAVENKRWHEIMRERVWAKMCAEGDAQVGISWDGVAQEQGFVISRLRDMARYGMLYTPSWSKAARERVVPEAYVKTLQTTGRKGIYLKGEMGNRMTKKYFPASPPIANCRQWDAVFADGDLYKSGLLGQGIYVSPDKDVVICWFSSVAFTDLTQYARAIALSYPAPGNQTNRRSTTTGLVISVPPTRYCT